MMKKRNNIFNSNKSEAGFSLIEVIIAIGLMAFLGLNIIQTNTNASKQHERIIKEDTQFVQAEMAMERIDTDLTQIYSPLYFSAPKKISRNRRRSYNDPYSDPSTTIVPYKPTKMFPRESKDGYPIPLLDDDKGFSFLTFSNRRKFEDTKQSNYAWIKYSLRNITLKDGDKEFEGKKEKGPYELIRTYIPDNIYHGDLDWSKTKPQILLRFVKKIKFEFWHAKRQKFVENLRDLNDPKSVNLRLIKVTIKWINKKKKERSFTRIVRPLWPIFDTKKDNPQQMGR